LSGSFNKAAIVYVAYINNCPVAMTSWLHFPHNKIKNAKKEHRTVVLPDYQGVGIATSLRDYVAERLKQSGFVPITTLSHPALINSMSKNRKWRMTRKGRTGRQSDNSTLGDMKISGFNRITTSWRYVG